VGNHVEILVNRWCPHVLSLSNLDDCLTVQTWLEQLARKSCDFLVFEICGKTVEEACMCCC
jgi:hypothetical protein